MMDLDLVIEMGLERAFNVALGLQTCLTITTLEDFINRLQTPKIQQAYVKYMDRIMIANSHRTS